MKIYLLRHGETDFNRAGIIMGHLDIPLNANGKDQAIALAEELKPLQPTLIYSSDLSRARQTAEIIATRFYSKIVCLNEFREKAGGAFEGRFWKQEYDKLSYEEFEELVAQQGGETIEAFENRVWNIFIDLIKKHKYDDSLIIVTHGGPIKIILQKIFNAPSTFYRTLQQDNCAINIIEVMKMDNTPVLKVLAVNKCPYFQ